MGYRVLDWRLICGSSQVNSVCRPAGARGGASELQWVANSTCVTHGVGAQSARWRVCYLGVVRPRAAKDLAVAEASAAWL